MRFLLFILTGLMFTSCSGSDANYLATDTKDSLRNTGLKGEGIQGVVEVPELLTLAIKDSATFETISEKIATAYNAIQKDIEVLNLEVAGSQGLLIYTNDPKNFVFECVIPIKAMPKEKPKNSTIVILEKTRAVVYDYYGPYEKMSSAYDKLKVYMSENKLLQTSATREFYITDPQAEPDTAKWLSKIYLPVK